jgi:hypothetical protein
LRVREGYESVPKVSEFFGISIYVYYRDHGPPHFHALYGGDEVLVSIEDLSVLEGKLSPRAMGLVTEWATLHQDELRVVWGQAKNHEPLSKIEPLR